MIKIIEKLRFEGDLTDGELIRLITESYDTAVLFCTADEVRQRYYGKKVFLRGLIEISSYCRNDCLYCGIRRSNGNAGRYRLSEDEILSCCENGYRLGLRTFVMQGGEDAYYNDDIMCGIIGRIKKSFPDCAVTLSLGERPYESYKRMFDAGADRYLLRHETAEDGHYARLHPQGMSLDVRKRCLFDLKRIGYQTGSGFMVGSPYQTPENILADLRFLQELKPEMIGIGPFIRHRDTPFAEFESGSIELTLRLISILRLMFPKALLPATTALGTLTPDGRERGLRAGANVVMPNLSPTEARDLYNLYDNKLCTGAEAAEGLAVLKAQIAEAGYEAVSCRGDAIL